MNIKSEFAQACAEFEEVRKLLLKGRELTESDNLRQQLQALAQALDENFAELKQVVPAAADELEGQLKQTEQELTRALRELEAQQKSLEEAPTALSDVAAEPTIPAVVAEAALGKTLQEELLRLFGDPNLGDVKKPPVIRDPGSVGGMTSSEWE